MRVGRPSSFGDKLELRGLSATKIEPSGGGSNLEWNHWEGRCNFNWTNSHPPDYSATVNQQEGDLFWPCLDGEGRPEVSLKGIILIGIKIFREFTHFINLNNLMMIHTYQNAFGLYSNISFS